MKFSIRILLIIILLISVGAYLMYYYTIREIAKERIEKKVLRVVYLPLPRLKGDITLEEAIALRRSIREYEEKPLALEQLAQILWAAQGITDVKREFRAAPSAGATYPLELYVVVGHKGVVNLEAGIYHYDPKAHVLKLLKHGDFRVKLYEACIRQTWVKQAPVVIVVTAVYERTTLRYGERGIKYVHMEVGHVGQNIYLQATALGLGTVVVGAFYDEEVKKVLGLSEQENPLYVIPIGHPKWRHEITIKELKDYIEQQRKKYKG